MRALALEASRASGAFLLLLKAYMPGSMSPGFHSHYCNSAPGHELRFGATCSGVSGSAPQ